MEDRIVIIGAGPTGLGAAWRLQEAGYQNWLLLEKDLLPGGLSASFKDEKGFTWDLGGHVQFSHYRYFDKLMDELLGKDGWLQHERESWVWMRGRFIPYPFQQNLRHLPHEEMKECVQGLVQLYKQGNARKPENFAEWVNATFGEGIARVFMRPYNFKVWAYPLEMMGYSWIGERVAVTDLSRVLNNILDATDELSWGPNNTFRFPRHGGTGAVWHACARRLSQEKLRYGVKVVHIDTSRHEVHLADGSVEEYDKLLTTMPVTRFVEKSDLAEKLGPLASRLRHSSTHVVGLGMTGAPREEVLPKCWMYFPEEDNPFYRVTVFSNYSPNNVPDISRYWSLMAEVSESPYKQVDSRPEALVEEVIQGALNTKLIDSRERIVDTWHARLEYGYPTPTLERDSVIFDVLPELEKRDVGSRGRFGAWRYEVANQDHSLMQGVEWVNHVLYGADELTLWHPEVVNNLSRPALKTKA